MDFKEMIKNLEVRISCINNKILYNELWISRINDNIKKGLEINTLNKLILLIKNQNKKLQKSYRELNESLKSLIEAQNINLNIEQLKKNISK